MKCFKFGQELSLLALDAAYEIDTAVSGSCVASVRELGKRLTSLRERLVDPYGDVEASVFMSAIFKRQGLEVETLEDLRQCLQDVTVALEGDLLSISANNSQLMSFCIALANLPVPIRHAAFS